MVKYFSKTLHLTSLLFLKKMKKYFIVIAVLTGIGLMVSSFINFPGKEKKIRFIRNDAEKKVDVLVDDHLFTSYIYPDNIKKPVLYPLTTPMGTRITRRFPLEHSVGERTDHPHHVGLWFNYGDVNGLDFGTILILSNLIKEVDMVRSCIKK